MGKLTPKIFSNAELEKIQRRLETDHEAGQPTDYEVLVDGMRVLPRNNDPFLFDRVSDYIELESTYEIEVRFYAGNSQTRDRLFLRIPENNPNRKQGKEETLDGIKVQLRDEMRAEKLREDYSRLKDDHEELSAYCEKIEEQLEHYKGKKLYLGDTNLMEVGVGLLTGFLRTNPGVLKRIPGGAVLAGAIEADNLEQQLPVSGNDPSAQATFSRVEENAGLSKEELAELDLIRRMRTTFTQGEFESVMGLLDQFTEDKTLIGKVNAFVKSAHPDTNQNRQSEDSNEESDYNEDF